MKDNKQVCVRCGEIPHSRRDCHQCGGILCDHVCEEWHLEKDCKPVESVSPPAQEVKRYSIQFFGVMGTMSFGATMNESKTGQYVALPDHTSKCAELEDVRQELQRVYRVLRSHSDLREAAEAELERVKLERDAWQEDAKRYATNADYWKGRFEGEKQ